MAGEDPSDELWAWARPSGPALGPACGGRRAAAPSSGSPEPGAPKRWGGLNDDASPGPHGPYQGACHATATSVRSLLLCQHAVASTGMTSPRPAPKPPGYSAENGGVSGPTPWVAERPGTLNAPPAAPAVALPGV